METLASTLSRLINEKYDQSVTPTFEHPDAQFGDFATNIALQLAKPLGRNPRDIATELKAALDETGEFKEVTVAGPGFINLRLTDEKLREQLAAKPTMSLSGVRYVIEYSCPNAFKELHTGHLYNTIFGDILARLIERAGATVNRTSFGGDV